MRSMVAASTAATAQAMARSRMRAANTSRRSGSICLLSLRPRMGASGERITAAATTAPNRDPRPTSSAPAMNSKPRARSSRSRMPWHFQRGSLGNLAARAMSCPARGLSAFPEASGFSLEAAQIVKLGAADLAGAYHVDMVDDRRAQREDALDAVAKTDFADGDGLAHAGILAGEHGAFKNLDALFFAFLDLDVNLDGIAGTERGQVGAALLFDKLRYQRVLHFGKPFGGVIPYVTTGRVGTGGRLARLSISFDTSRVTGTLTLALDVFF